MPPKATNEHRLERAVSRALLRADMLHWDGPPARVQAAGEFYRIMQSHGSDVIAEGEAFGAGRPPPGEGLAVLFVNQEGRMRWFRLDRKQAVRLAGYN
jgi:hypothetical protein